jgi:hypothetical protein
MKSALLGVLCVLVLCVIFPLGLWPFHAPRNEVTWLEQSNGIKLGRYGSVLSSGEFGGSDTNAAGSIEIWARPVWWLGSATLLALYRQQDHVLFTLNQSLTDLELAIETGRRSKTHFNASEALGPSLQQKKPVFITVTSGEDGTKVYLDGALRMTAPRFMIPREVFAGRLIVGDSPLQPNSFRGQIRGVAIYDGELNAAQVLNHYRSWTGNGAPEIAQEERNIALYLFGEKAGRVVHNRVSGGGVDLDIPNCYTVIDKIALEPFWTEFDFSKSYWSGNLKNIVGFLPVGFCFYAWILAMRPAGRAVLLTLFLGFLVSLTIEVFQIFLPTRDSGTTDLFTNTLGTYIGIFCYREIYPIIVKQFPILGWMQVTELRPESNSKHPTHCSS